MRGAFGLVSLLICVAIVAYVWAKQTSTTSNTQTAVHDQVTQLSGHGADGKSAMESVKLEPENGPGGKLKSLVVTDVVAGGAMEKFYGFQKGDKIIGEGQGLSIADGDAGMANAMLLDAFEKFQSIEVIRDGKQISLPTDGAAGHAMQDQFTKLQHLPGQ